MRILCLSSTMARWEEREVEEEGEGFVGGVCVWFEEDLEDMGFEDLGLLVDILKKNKSKRRKGRV